jgi:hypothetical protein
MHTHRASWWIYLLIPTPWVTSTHAPYAYLRRYYKHCSHAHFPARQHAYTFHTHTRIINASHQHNCLVYVRRWCVACCKAVCWCSRTGTQTHTHRHTHTNCRKCVCIMYVYAHTTYTHTHTDFNATALLLTRRKRGKHVCSDLTVNRRRMVAMNEAVLWSRV